MKHSISGAILLLSAITSCASCGKDASPAKLGEIESRQDSSSTHPNN